MRGLVILIEEPELYLSPPGQRHLHRLLRRLAARGRNQVLYSTHSPVFLGVDRVEQLVLVRHDDRTGTTLLQPDGTQEVLVPVSEAESIADPQVSFDGQWVYYAKMHDAVKHKGADIYKVHVPTRKIVRLTDQTFTPNTGAADWKKTPLPSWGVYNLGPCPLPGGRVAFVSDRNAFKANNPGYAPNALALG